MRADDCVQDRLYRRARLVHAWGDAGDRASDVPSTRQAISRAGSADGLHAVRRRAKHRAARPILRTAQAR